MNVNISFNEKSGEMDLKTEDSAENTSFVPDAGAPPADLGLSANENLDSSDDSAVSSNAEDIDIGGPPEWLVQATASSLVEEEELPNDTDIDDIDDGGSGPSE